LLLYGPPGENKTILELNFSKTVSLACRHRQNASGEGGGHGMQHNLLQRVRLHYREQMARRFGKARAGESLFYLRNFGECQLWSFLNFPFQTLQ
jgi:hypothetical protein